jgi:hypothetical protein
MAARLRLPPALRADWSELQELTARLQKDHGTCGVDATEAGVCAIQA